MTATPLAAAVLAHAGELEDVVVAAAGSQGPAEIVAGGVLVAVVGADGLEVRLRPAVASAALRTPDTAESARGKGWVRFAPGALDQHAQDRALAWLDSAVRRALEGDEPA